MKENLLLVALLKAVVYFFSYLVMGQFMEQRKTWMPSYEAAINRTMEGDFAFISDRPILNFVSRQKEYCGKFKVIGG